MRMPTRFSISAFLLFAAGTLLPSLIAHGAVIDNASVSPDEATANSVYIYKVRYRDPANGQLPQSVTLYAAGHEYVLDPSIYDGTDIVYAGIWYSVRLTAGLDLRRDPNGWFDNDDQRQKTQGTRWNSNLTAHPDSGDIRTYRWGWWFTYLAPGATDPDSLEIDGIGPTVHDTIHSEYDIDPTPDPAPPYYLRYRYGGIKEGKDWMAAYPIGYPTQWWEDPLEVTPYVVQFPDEGTTSSTYIFRIHYLNEDNLAPSPWVTNAWDYWNMGGDPGRPFESGVMLYLRNIDTGALFEGHHMYPIDPGDTGYDSGDGVPFILRVGPVGPITYTGGHTRSTLAWTASTNHYYEALPPGRYEYFFACSDDVYSAFEGQKDWVWPTLDDLPALPVPEPPYDATGWFGYRGLNWPTGIMTRYNPTTKLFQDYLCGFVDKATYFPGVNWNYFLSGPYPYDSWSGWGTSLFRRRVSYPQVDPGLYEIGFSAGEGRTRFLGTLDPYRRAVNPRIGNQGSGAWRMWAETAGGTDKDVFTFQVNYWQSNGEQPIYVRLYINNDWNGDDPRKPFRSYDMQVYPEGYAPTRDDYKTGVLYRVLLSVGELGYGPHCYYFETSDPQWFDSARNVWVGSRVCRYPRRLDTITYDGSVFHDFNLPNVGDSGSGMPVDNDFINGPYINTRCVLTNWRVTPTIGPGGTDFVFSITYTDPDNQRPYQPHVIIQLADGYWNVDGVYVVRCNMVKADPIRDGWVPGLVIPADNLTRPYDQGVVYLFHTSSVPDLRLQPGTRKHYFEFIDDWGRQSDQNDLIKGEVVRKPDSTWFDGPQVTANIVPSLFDGEVESADGTHDDATLWSFKVKYRDADDQAPVYIVVFLGVLESSGIVWDAGHQMLVQNPADTVYSDGREYYYSTRLSGSADGKQYYYCFVASDGVDRAEHNATTSPSSGMVWFPNRPAGQLPKGEILDPEPGSTTVFLFDHFPVVNNVPASPLNPAFYQNPLLYQNGTRLTTAQYSLIPDDGKLILVNPATGEITASYFFGTAHPEKVNITNPPYLRDYVLTPQTGETTTTFTYEITYADTDGPNGQAPSGVYVVIDGVRQLMTPKTTSRSYSSGVRYQYKTTLSSGAHTYYFEASDGVAFAIYDAEGEKRSNTQISGKIPISGPFVNDRPTLTDGEIDPPNAEIDVSQSVTYLITYTDIDNEGPSSGYPVVYVDNPNEIDYDCMVTAVTDNSIQDNTQNWPVNTFAGQPVQMTSGTNPTVFKIESNTSNTLVLVDNDIASKVSLGDTFSITKLRMVKSNADDQNFADGCIYEVSVPGLGVGIHGAHFKSVTLEQEMPGVTRTTTVRYPLTGVDPPYTEMPGPTVNLIAPPGNVAPVLSEPNLTPSTGSSSTLFTFSVKYQDTNGDSPNQPHDNITGHIRLVLDGQNYDMATPDVPNWVTGETCTYTISGLAPGPHYYHFSASDGWVITRLPASPADEYIMYISRPPVLSEGTVVPMTGNAGRSYEYQVRYKDPDGQPPTSLKVVIDGEEKEIGVPIPGGDYMNAGVMYSYPLPAGTATVADHTFYFSATDGNGYAVFDYDLAKQTTRSRSSSSPITDIDGIPGPYIHDSTAPTLSAGAVQPLNGWESDTFVYSVIYTDAENDEPEYVKVYIDGSSDAHAFALTKDPNKDDYSTGVTYTLSKAGLPAGSHTYYFTASDYLAVARLPASGVLGGPNVVARQPATITIDYTPASPSIGSSVEVSGKITDPQARALSVPLKIKRTSPNGTIVEIDQQSGVDGTYSYSWIPDVTGKWKVKVTWIGDSHFLPSESPEITIDVGGPSMVVSGLDMISIPFQLSTGFPDGVFGTQPPFALAKWIPSLAAYKMYSLLPQYRTDFDFPMIATGHSYWIKTLQSKTIRPSGRLITSTTYSVVLGVGWNQVGCPYTFQVNWSSLKVRYNDLTVSLVEAANNGWIRPFGWTYDPASGGYRLVDANRSGAERVMRPWRGYWVKALVNCSLIITGGTSPAFAPTSADGSESTMAFSSASSVAKWEVRIGARNGKLSDDSNYFGVSRSKADRMESPAMLENYVDLYFTDKDGGVYASDLKTDASVKDGWQFNVTTDTPGQVELTWDGMESVPDDVRLVLVDTAENKPVDLVPGGSYKFDIAQGEADRSFRILYQSR